MIDKKEYNNINIPCEVYSRVCGFYRPISQFNIGKKEEFIQRKEIILTDTIIENLQSQK